MDYFGGFALLGVIGYVTTDVIAARTQSNWTDKVAALSDFGLAITLGYFGSQVANQLPLETTAERGVQVLGLACLAIFLAFLVVRGIDLIRNPSRRLDFSSPTARVHYQLRWLTYWFSLGGSILAVTLWPTSTVAWLAFAASCALHAYAVAQTIELAPTP